MVTASSQLEDIQKENSADTIDWYDSDTYFKVFFRGVYKKIDNGLMNTPIEFVKQVIQNYKASKETYLSEKNLLPQQQNGESKFTLNHLEFLNLDKAVLSFIPYCGDINDVGVLDIFINDNKLFSAVPVCNNNYKQNIPKSALYDGDNKIVFKTNKGSYNVEQIKIALDFKEGTGSFGSTDEKVLPNLFLTESKSIIPEKSAPKVLTEQKEPDINSIINQGKKITNSLKEKQQIKFNILGEDHSMTVDKVAQNSATLTFSSTPLTFVIELLKTIIVDINQDGKEDLAVTLKSISNGIADLEFSQPSGNEQITKPINKATAPTINFNANMKYIVIGIITLVVLISGGYGLVTIYKKRPKRAKEEKTEEEPKEVIERPAISKSADAISVSGFSLRHGKNVILENISFEIKRGELVCLLGPSGTGKSTIIESLVGRKTPDKGIMRILGEDIKKNKIIMDYVGFVPQGAEIYMNQTAEQNLLTSATKWGIKDAKKKAERILSDINLTQRANIEAKKLSGGQQKLLSLGMELIREPELLILDEPTTGLDPNTRNNIITIISQIVAQRHKTALFTTHFMDDAEECDNVIILADKKIVAQGNPSKLKKMLPGTGRIVNVILDNVTDELLIKIKKIEGIKEIIREGRSLKIITEEPNAVKLGQKIDELGGLVNKTEIVNATMKEVFVYFTGKQPEE